MDRDQVIRSVARRAFIKNRAVDTVAIPTVNTLSEALTGRAVYLPATGGVRKRGAVIRAGAADDGLLTLMRVPKLNHCARRATVAGPMAIGFLTIRWNLYCTVSECCAIALDNPVGVVKKPGTFGHAFSSDGFWFRAKQICHGRTGRITTLVARHEPAFRAILCIAVEAIQALTETIPTKIDRL